MTGTSSSTSPAKGSKATTFAAPLIQEDAQEHQMALREQFPREWAIFNQIDVNSDGYVSEDELCLMCRKLGIHWDISRDIARKVFEDMLLSHNYLSRTQSVDQSQSTTAAAGAKPGLSEEMYGEAALAAPPSLLSPPISGGAVSFGNFSSQNRTSGEVGVATPAEKKKAREQFDASGEPGLRFEDMIELFSEIYAVRRLAREKQWKRCIGLGVAGNVAGHMEMAGEADKKKAGEEKKDAAGPATPAAIFAFYIPESATQSVAQNSSPTKRSQALVKELKHELHCESSFSEREGDGEGDDGPLERISVSNSSAPPQEAADKSSLNADGTLYEHGEQGAANAVPPSPGAVVKNTSVNPLPTMIDDVNDPESKRLSIDGLANNSSGRLSNKTGKLQRRSSGNSNGGGASSAQLGPDDSITRINGKSIVHIEALMNEQEVCVQENANLKAVIGRLGRFPVTNAVISYPKEGGNVQVEPEVALYCDILYNSSGPAINRAAKENEAGRKRQVVVEKLVPRKIAAFNDCSIRQLRGSEKLSEKKNWGHGSKGISLDAFRLTDPKVDFSPQGLASRLVLVSYVKRGDDIHLYTQAAPARNYLMFYNPLLKWITEQMNYQSSVDKWEDINELLEAADYPMSCWIALGAGEYTEWGMKNFMQPRDETVVIIYDESVFPEGPDAKEIEQLFNDHGHIEVNGLVALHQTFVQED